MEYCYFFLNKKIFKNSICSKILMILKKTFKYKTLGLYKELNTQALKI